MSDPRGRWFSRVGEEGEARDLVLRHHYSGRWPGVVRLVVSHHEPGGLFGDRGEIVAAAVFSVPPAHWREDVLELSRLVRRPDRPGHPLTALIADACRVLRDRREVDLVVSFADAGEGHHGGVYQAASWRFHGLRGRSVDGVVVRGHFVPGRTATSWWGTRSPGELVKLGVPAEPHFDEGKYLYWRALTRSGRAKARRLGLESRQYPKPGWCEAAARLALPLEEPEPEAEEVAVA